MGTKPNGNSKSGTTPDADITTDSVKFYYCCRRDGIVAEPVDFANTKPFALVQQSAWGCQQIKGMGVYARAYSLMDPLLSDVFSASADGPRNFRSTETGETFFYYCYYYPRSDNSFPMPTCADREGQCPSLANSGQCHVPSVLTSCPYSCNTCPGPQGGSGTCTDTDSTCDPASCASYSTAQLEGCKFTCRQCPEFCGGLITLTDTDRSRTITSPNYPLNYDNSMDCFWQIKGPEDSFLVMKFDDFDLAGSGFSCSDNLDINYGLQGQEGLHYCGQDMFETIRSIDNVIEMRLITDFRNTGKGFNATVTLVSPEDHCYDLGKSGQNYRGNVNYTRDFKICLPWDEVKHCRHSAYAPYDLLDGLDKNYCRNPGDGLRPWCYYESGKCRRNYCDVCGLESAYDTIDDCDAFKTAGSCANEAEARAKCARTCQDQLPAPNTAAYTDIQCTSPPTSPPDGTPTTTLQGPYSLGDTVTFTCSDTPSFFRLTTCLSDGSWSPIGYACGGCPEDWAYYRGHCYKEQREAMDYNNARGRCQSLGADMVEARDEEAIRFLILLRDDGHRQWMGLKRDHTRGYHVWQDGTEPTPSFWNARDARGSDCAVLQADKTWVSFYCENEALFVCRLQARVAGVCADLISNCASRIADDPAVCTDQPDFAQLLCPNSCHVGNCQGAVSDRCSPSPCQNGGTCQVQSGSYTCTCADQYEGTNCQTMTVSDPCFPSPCQNGGSCQVQSGSYTCTCTDQYEGTNCQTVKVSDPCSPSPCQNGGSCQVQSGSYTCTCTDQYEGTNCQTMTVSDPCSPSPCQNGGSCQVQSGSYTCTCSNEYEGTNCQREAVQAVGGCVDTDGSCSTWVTQGGCTGPRKHYVLHACRDSCSFCDDNAAACVDKNTYCAYWADEYDPPQCPVNPGYMLPNCQKSCGLCDGEGCVDQQSNCYQLAQRGECESNDSVKAVCPHACGLCFNPLCPDLAEDCSVRAAQGDCSLYTEDMESNCPYSCGKCREYMSNPCYGAPCQHGGTCTVDTTNTNGFTCTCAEGYLGDTCASKEPDPVATCAAGWSQSQGACYKRSTGRQKYDQAQAECATGMASSVATIKSEEEKNFVNNLAGTIVWLGGDKRDKANFTWSDGTLVKDGYSAWRKGEPNGKVGTLSDVNCMIMTSMGQWVDYTCTGRKRFFVCKYPLS
ncbi:hypothetical protein V1264_014565 [Littorina saxatilis]|uniref:Uncharacterized protein n=2 Tax=Littorina saxatilis TaxID=31220 RepID=A0AAN9BW47_9CAEN